MIVVKPSPRFKRIMEQSETVSELVPVLYGYLDQGRLPDPFKLQVRGGTGDRGPDGWFHPSEHPLLSARQLYYYLTEPAKWRSKQFDLVIKVSALMGSVMHEIVETALQDLGFLMVPKGICPACGLEQPSKCKEFGASDEETKARGHQDGRLKIEGVVKGFEFKSCAPRVLNGVRSNDIEQFKKKWPYYYAQVQEYMRMTGLRVYVVLFWSMGNPWEMREFNIPFDPIYAGEVRARYLEARRAAEAGVPPMHCCSPGSAQAKSCPAMGCPVKRM